MLGKGRVATRMSAGVTIISKCDDGDSDRQVGDVPEIMINIIYYLQKPAGDPPTPKSEPQGPIATGEPDLRVGHSAGIPTGIRTWDPHMLVSRLEFGSTRLVALLKGNIFPFW